ncbi:hypothetical protein NLD30_04045, partial [SCandidatus Aminicenantes bacterium Aminicenantia_JdfR_composite]|nr:hypothetical protein [SCandidatus Aminicenantes bacterium Aminicenantia_JdfR_composite]
FIVVYLQNPKEVYWGKLISLKMEGIQIRGLNINSFNEWLRKIDPFSLSTIFFPMPRVEKILLDESSGETLSFKEQVEKITKKSITEFFDF